MRTGEQRSFNFRELAKEEWDLYWPKVNFSSLYQSWEYGEAKKAKSNWVPRRFICEDEIIGPISMVQILTKKLPIFGDLARINRGPLLINNNKDQTSLNLQQISLYSLSKLAKKNRWSALIMSPEIEEIQAANFDFSTYFLKLSIQEAWGSSWLDLTISKNDLLKGLKGKWRNSLKKAQKSNLKISQVNLNSENLNILLDFYTKAKEAKKFGGIDGEFIKLLSKQESRNFKVRTFFSYDDDYHEVIGVLVSVLHGSTATYLIGNTNFTGRSKNANYSMLWSAILDAQDHGCSYFDLGGMTSNTPLGVYNFKKGLKGTEYSLIKGFLSFPIFYKNL